MIGGGRKLGEGSETTNIVVGRDNGDDVMMVERGERGRRSSRVQVTCFLPQMFPTIIISMF